MKKNMLLGMIVVGVLVVIVVVSGFIRTRSNTPRVGDHYLELNGKKIELLIADTEAKRVQGLSGHAPLRENQAMLFSFPNSSDWGMWMKDMTFPIDILWLDSDMRVITAEQNVSPDSYPRVFRPTMPALYVLEASAGFIAKNGIVYQEQLKIK